MCASCYHMFMKERKNPITSVLMKKVLTEKRNEVMMSLVKEGYNYNQIALMFNVAHTTVLRVINK